MLRMKTECLQALGDWVVLPVFFFAEQILHEQNFYKFLKARIYVPAPKSNYRKNGNLMLVHTIQRKLLDGNSKVT